MVTPLEKQAIHLVETKLSEIIGKPVSTSEQSHQEWPWLADAIQRIGEYTFAIEVKKSGNLGQVVAAVQQLRGLASTFPVSMIPLVIVPYMDKAGREYCAENRTAWMDLSGNAHIVAPGLIVEISGNPNKFRQRGRPASIFTPKAARIARWLLAHPNEALSQREIAKATNMKEPYTSIVVRGLLDSRLIERNDDGKVLVRRPGLLLDAWREQYGFKKHRIMRGHVVARSGDELVSRIGTVFEELHLPYAMTGLSGAWLLGHYAGFRLVSTYLREPPSAQLLKEIAFRDDPRGANLWLIVPNDEGVFQGTAYYEGFRCVHPIQVYLDLADHPERAQEVAELIRKQFLTWNE